MSKLNELVSRVAKRGSADDFQQIADILKTDRIDDTNELISGLRALLYYAPLQGHRHKFAALGERYLKDTKEPFLASQLLTMLCSYVYSVDRYADFIKEALRGLDWDIDGDLQTTAATLSRDLYNLTKDSEIICILIEVLNTQQQERYYNAYEALLEITQTPNKLTFQDWLDNEPKQLIDWSLVRSISLNYGCSKRVEKVSHQQ